MANHGSILALDLGAVRVGLALASRAAKLPAPYGTLANDYHMLDALRGICQKEQVDQLVIGLPRGLEGQETAQTMTVRALGMDIARDLDLPVAWQDETLTSVKAEAELTARGRNYHKADIDALAAVFILEDYLHEHL